MLKNVDVDVRRRWSAYTISSLNELKGSGELIMSEVQVDINRFISEERHKNS